MAMEFNRIITLLRKERGITQKQAAADLGISQAQLSHYEKGIRECGLEFVVQVADYYGVSCDYLLGRSAERSGQTITVEELPEGSATAGSVWHGSVLPTMYKKLIENSLDILFDKLDHCKDKRVVTAVSNYLMLAVYSMFRQLYQAAPKNVASLFRLGPARWEHAAEATMARPKGGAGRRAGRRRRSTRARPGCFCHDDRIPRAGIPAPCHQSDEPCQKQ